MESRCRNESITDRLTDHDSPVFWTGFFGFSVLLSVGIGLNVVVVVFSFTLNELKGKDFRFFLLNLSLIDIGFAIFFFAVHVLLGTDPFFCYWGSLLYTSFCMISVNGTVPIIVNRYVAICRPDDYEAVFGSKFKIALCCLEPYLVGIFIVAGCAPFAGVGADHYNLFCLLIDERVFLIGILFGDLHEYGILLFCSYKIWLALKEAKGRQMSLQLQNKVEETEFLLKTVLVQALSPILLQTPVTIMQMMTCGSISRWFFLFSVFILTAMVPVDGLSSLFFVKPYRKAFKALLSRNRVEPIS